MRNILEKLRTMFHALSRQERIAFIAACALFAVSIGGLLVREVYTRTNVVAARGGEYREGFVGQPSFVNPVLAAGEIDRSITRLLFANLADLADSVDASKDGRTWKVRLAPGLAWSDGRKLTSDDVIFTIQKSQDSEARSPLAQSWQGVNAARLSELEIQFALAAPYAYFEENLRSLYVLPKHIWNDIPVANWRLSDHNLKPVGSGPYRFESYNKESSGFITQYKMKPNENYRREKPFIEELAFAFFPDGGALLAAFNKGMVDGLSSPDPAMLKNVKRSYRLHEFRLPSYYAIFINQSQTIPLKELAVREALSHALDREELAAMVFEEHALPAYGPVPPGSDAAKAPHVKISLDDAAKKLDDAGWKVGADGVREKAVKDGRIKLTVAITVPEIPFLVKTAEEIKIVWQRLGVQATVSPLPIGETMAETIKNRDYQALLFGNVLHESLDLYPFWNSKERFAPGLNLSLYSNKNVDELTDAMQRELNGDVRAAKRAEAEAAIVADAPAVFLYSPDYLFLASKELKGAEADLIGEPADRFLGAAKWYVKTSRTAR